MLPLLLLQDVNFNEMTTDLRGGRRQRTVGVATGLSYIFIAHFSDAQKCVMHEHLASAGKQKESQKLTQLGIKL